MPTCSHGVNHPAFVLTGFPDGTVDVAVCWDSTNVREISEKLRQVAAELDALPADHSARGIKPLI